MEVTAEQKKEWNEYDYGHQQVIRELSIDSDNLPNEIKARIRGFNLGLSKINSPEGFNKLITQSAAIGDDIITWNERDAKEEETAETSTDSAALTKTSTDSAAPTQTQASSGSTQKNEELTEEQVLAQHSGTKKILPSNSNDGGGYFGWDDDE